LIGGFAKDRSEAKTKIAIPLVRSKFTLSSKAQLKKIAVSRKDTPIVSASPETDAAVKREIGVRSNSKNPHLRTGVTFIAKYPANANKIKLKNLPT